MSPKYSNNTRQPSDTKNSIKNKKRILQKKGFIACENTPNYLINDIYLLLMDECINITKNN